MFRPLWGSSVWRNNQRSGSDGKISARIFFHNNLLHYDNDNDNDDGDGDDDDDDDNGNDNDNDNDKNKLSTDVNVSSRRRRRFRGSNTSRGGGIRIPREADVNKEQIRQIFIQVVFLRREEVSFKYSFSYPRAGTKY